MFAAEDGGALTLDAQRAALQCDAQSQGHAAAAGAQGGGAGARRALSGHHLGRCADRPRSRRAPASRAPRSSRWCMAMLEELLILGAVRIRARRAAGGGASVASLPRALAAVRSAPGLALNAGPSAHRLQPVARAGGTVAARALPAAAARRRAFARRAGRHLAAEARAERLRFIKDEQATDRSEARCAIHPTAGGARASGPAAQGPARGLTRFIQTETKLMKQLHWTSALRTRRRGGARAGRRSAAARRLAGAGRGRERHGRQRAASGHPGRRRRAQARRQRGRCRGGGGLCAGGGLSRRPATSAAAAS